MAASTAEPPNVVAPTHELPVYLLTAMELVQELTFCPVTGTEAVPELTFVLSWPLRLLLCLLRHGSLLCRFCHCPILQTCLCYTIQVLFPFMGLALPWIMSVPPPLDNSLGLFGFCFCFVRASGAALRGGICKVYFWFCSMFLFSCLLF